MKAFPEKVDFPAEERGIVEFWKEHNCFLTSLEKSRGREPYSFYDGPPFATGTPHYGHMLAGSLKDAVCRYAHQTGHHVERRFGWDCHGLPIEFEIEKKLGIKTKQDVLALGIPKYNAACRAVVLEYVDEWEKTMTRAGRWVDFKNDYKTMDLTFMESVWWVFSELYKKGLVYRGTKIMPYSTGCTTPLSNFEAGMNYQDVHDPSVFITFPTAADPTVQFVAWTTTPWTLPSNLAICVNPTMKYVKVKDLKSGNTFIFAEFALNNVYPKYTAAKEAGNPPCEILEVVTGESLRGVQYIPLFDCFSTWKGAFRVLVDDYVREGAEGEGGTGVVHIAPGFGADDYRVCLTAGIVTKEVPPPCPIDEKGHFTSEVADYAQRYIKEAENDICAAIKAKHRLISKQSAVHKYPFCWRSQTPLIYRCVACWFVNVEALKEKIIANNKKTYWVPEYVGTKRFHNWLEDAVDWCVSRNRYWGTPLPVWRSDDWEEIVCISSIKELSELTGQEIKDLHRESIDHLKIPSRMGKGELSRIEEVFDCWFESGSMPYGQCHYPFENKEFFESAFPANFIAEGLDQTRGWFYTLMVLSTALFDKPAFQNLVVNGIICGEDGQKLSKRDKNYTDPVVLMETHTADAIRLMLLSSPAVRAENLKFKDEDVKDVVKDVLIPVWNTAKFFAQCFVTFAEGGEFDSETQTDNEMDIWIRQRAEFMITNLHNEMGKYRLYNVLEVLKVFIHDLSNWYVRMNKRRLKGQNGRDEAHKALATLQYAVFRLIMAMCPFAPFLSENLYQRLKASFPPCLVEDSVHYLMIPKPQWIVPNTQGLAPAGTQYVAGAAVRFDLNSASQEDVARVLDNSPAADEIIQRRPLREWHEVGAITDYRTVVKLRDAGFSLAGRNKLRPMQQVIERVRVAREKSKISTRFPVKEIIVVHPDPEYRDDIKLMEEYIKDETNCLTIKIMDSAADFVELSAQANMQSVGKKFKKQGKAIGEAMRGLSEDAIVQFMNDGQLILELDEQIILAAEDVKIIRTPKAQAANYVLEFAHDGFEQLVVLVDKDTDENLYVLNCLREFVNRVQQLRKRAGLTPSDAVDVYYTIPQPIPHLEQGLKENMQSVVEALRARVINGSPPEGSPKIVEEEVEIRDSSFTLHLAHATA